jgi:puromycin-sensitive aminopeptidase
MSAAKPSKSKGSSKHAQSQSGGGGKTCSTALDSEFGRISDDEAAADGLLPDDVSPLHYALHLTPNYADWTFAARVVILLRISAETDLIQFNAAELVIKSASLATASGVLEPTRIQDDQDEEVTTLRFDEPLRVGEATLTLEYSGKLSEKMNGLYKSQYLHAGETQTILVTQFEACDARRALPCWDEPARKATFGVTLCVPSRYTALSNMPLSSSTPAADKDGWTEFRFLDTPLMSTYLLAFAVGEFESIQTTTKSGTLVRLLTPLGKIDQGAFSLDLGRRCLEFYAEYFALDYPLPKLDLLAVPDIAIVAMENWGLITFGETALLVHPTESSQAGKSYVALLVAHEIAHQWFGNIVTMEWWTELWLNEGFASWMEYFCVDALFPEWKVRQTHAPPRDEARL